MIYFLKQEQAEVGVAVFLRQFTLHALDGGAEEEGDKKFAGAFATYLAVGIDVGRSILDIDDEERVTRLQKNPVGEETPCSAIIVA